MTTIERKTTTHTARSPRWAAVRDSYRSRRADRALYQSAELELSAYTSPADILELEAMLERTPASTDSVYAQVIGNLRVRAV